MSPVAGNKVEGALGPDDLFAFALALALGGGGDLPHTGLKPQGETMADKKKILVVQGQGMEMRGRVQVEIFGPETLDDINAMIQASAQLHGLEVDIYHSNDEAEVVAYINAAQMDALIINPSGFTATTGPLPTALSELTCPIYEVHASNPTARGVRSTLLPHCAGAVCGFGYAGYSMALGALAAGG
ncbi:MAG: type II 3-dehydroquinate dehydratase [Pseudomonadota bacterium]